MFIYFSNYSAAINLKQKYGFLQFLSYYPKWLQI